MIANETPSGAAVRGTGAIRNDDRSYVDWGAILAGAILAAAISLIMLTFGSAIGLGIASPLPGEGVSLFWFSIAAGLWLLWVQVSSFLAGGYLAGRLRRRIGDAEPDEVDMRDGSHGLLVWATGTLVAAVMVVSGIMGAAQTTAQAVGGAAEAVADVAADGAGDEFSAYLTDTLFRAEQRATSPAAVQARNEIGRIVARAVVEGELSPDDRTYVVNVIANQTGLQPEEVETRVDQTVQQIEAMQEEAMHAADEARRMGVMIGFLTAASLLVSAAAAYYAATMGGRHRDEGTVLPYWRAVR